jgi:hypothetical protein
MALPWTDLSEGCLIEAPAIKVPWTLTVQGLSELLPCTRKAHFAPGPTLMESFESTGIVRACGACGTRLICLFIRGQLDLVSFNFSALDSVQPVDQTVHSLEKELENRYGAFEDRATPRSSLGEIQRTWLIQNWRVRLGRCEMFSPNPYLVVERHYSKSNV